MKLLLAFHSSPPKLDGKQVAMKTQRMLGSFISLMLTLAEQVRYATSVPNLPPAQALARLPLTHLLARSIARTKRDSFNSTNRSFATAVLAKVPPPAFTRCCSNARLSTPGGERSSRSLNPAMAGSTIAPNRSERSS